MNPILTLQGISKRYGSVQALDNVSFDIYPGEVHAIVGENGAGKSTLVSILSGFVTPDSGTIALDGIDLPLGDAPAIRGRRVEMVHQHFMLVPNFSVSENLALSQIGQSRGKFDLNSATVAAKETADKLGWQIDWAAKTGSLPVGSQQRVEILKALSGNAAVLILDEPTAVLAPDEVEDLLGVLRPLKTPETAIILIAHKLSEVFSVADRVTVLRQGKLVSSQPTDRTNPEEVARQMVGERASAAQRQPAINEDTLLTVSELEVAGQRSGPAVRKVSFEVGRGEIFGIRGVDGNGQLELAEALAGIRHPEGGTIAWESGTPKVGYIPQDRQVDGLALTMSIQDNMTVNALDDSGLTLGVFLRPLAVSEWAKQMVAQYEIKAPSPKLPVGSLSGGNQQKVVVARVMSAQPDLIVAVNPTRGLDLRASDFVHTQIFRAAARGAVIILISTDRDELEAVADRIVFMESGQLSTRFLGVSP